MNKEKKRHEDFHKDESVGKVGARRRNWTFGKVDWDFKEDRNKTSMYEAEIKNEILKEMIEEEKKADEGRRGSGNTGSKVGQGMNMVGYSLDMLWKEFDIYGDSGRYKWNDDDFSSTKVGDDQSWIKFATKRGADPMEAKYFFFKKMIQDLGLPEKKVLNFEYQN